jgi:hypothetical protein
MFCSVYSVFIVLFYVLFVCKCVLYYNHRVSTQLQYHIHLHQWHGRWEFSMKICRFQSDTPTAWLCCLTDWTLHGGGSIFSRNQEPPSRRQKNGIIKQVSKISTASIRRHCQQFSSHGDLVYGVCISLLRLHTTPGFNNKSYAFRPHCTPAYRIILTTANTAAALLQRSPSGP